MTFLLWTKIILPTINTQLVDSTLNLSIFGPNLFNICAEIDPLLHHTLLILPKVVQKFSQPPINLLYVFAEVVCSLAHLRDRLMIPALLFDLIVLILDFLFSLIVVGHVEID